MTFNKRARRPTPEFLEALYERRRQSKDAKRATPNPPREPRGGNPNAAAPNPARARGEKEAPAPEPESPALGEPLAFEPDPFVFELPEELAPVETSVETAMDEAETEEGA